MLETNLKEHQKHVLHLTIDGKRFDWHQQYITGAELKRLGKIHQEDEILLLVKKPWHDELIVNDARVNLARPEIEHFVSKEKHVIVSLIVNSREKQWDKRKISFEQIVSLALGSWVNNPNSVVTVTFDRGPKENQEGSMVEGDVVFVKNKMIFNVTPTDKS
jgi:3-phosphoglycerate kinase